VLLRRCLNCHLIRKVVFSSDLVSEAGSMLIPPYKTTPAKLVELKKQVEDLLEKQL